MIKAVQAVVDSIMVIGVLTCCLLLHPTCDLKASQMNMQRSLFQELMLYEFERGHNTAETAENICCAKAEKAVDHSTVTRHLKKLH